MEFSKNKTSLKKAIRLKRLCKSCGKKGERHVRYIPIPEGGYTRECSGCHNILKYSDKNHFDRANKEKARCKSCAFKGRPMHENARKALAKAHETMKGVNHPRYGKRHNHLTKKRIGNANRIYNDITENCALRQRAFFTRWLKGCNNGFEKYVGKSIEDFREWFAIDFKEGMTWENRGQKTWHIDHIKPLCLYDLTNEQECKFAWNYMNLRPIWYKENLQRPKTGNSKKQDILIYIVDRFEKYQKSKNEMVLGK